jgi:peptidoglycan/xylan/chitin deacetylase (PgdA/CDA1 family)/folate-dependent phosphoribosylglycinamide formyltransferase PurN
MRLQIKETYMQASFRVVIFSGGDPAHIHRLVTRIMNEVPEAQVCGVLCERRPGKTLSKRTRDFLRNVRRREFVEYAASKVVRNFTDRISKAATPLLHFMHGESFKPAPVRDPIQDLKARGCIFRITTDYHAEDSLEFVRSLKPDLGIVYGTRILKPSLFSIPRLGSINIHKRKVPDYRGGGPVGLWEMLDEQTEIGVTVHQVTEKLDAGAVVNSATISIDPFDNLTSLALKAHVVGNDLLVRSVADFARGTLNLTVQQGVGRMFKNPSAEQLHKYQKELAKRRTAYRPAGARSLGKMLLKSVAAAPSITIRNWKRRSQGAFPVTILFHHLVSDRPHRMGISTEQFLRHVQFLQRHYQIVSLSEAIIMLRMNQVAQPSVVLTFDDGYRDNFINLRAVVEETGVPVTLFVSTDYVSRQVEFEHDIESGCRGFLPLTWSQLIQLQTYGVEIGSHTRTHFDCGSHDRTRLQDEIAGSKRELESHLGRPIPFFSFPFGFPENISTEAAETAMRTYPYVLSAFGGENGAGDGINHLKRWCHPNRLWDLELQIQGALEDEPRFELPPEPQQREGVRVPLPQNDYSV